jgi:hypothetical protein
MDEPQCGELLQFCALLGMLAPRGRQFGDPPLPEPYERGGAADVEGDGSGESGECYDRISSSTSSRFCSMSSGDTSDSRLSRSRGSVFDGRTLKCQSA